MLVLIIYPLPKKLIDFLKIGECVNIRDFILFRIVVHLIVVEFVITRDCIFDEPFALYQQVCKDILLIYLAWLHATQSPFNLIIITVIDYDSFNHYNSAIATFYLQDPLNYMISQSDLPELIQTDKA